MKYEYHRFIRSTNLQDFLDEIALDGKDIFWIETKEKLAGGIVIFHAIVKSDEPVAVEKKDFPMGFSYKAVGE
jgi:hypothetical protein